MAIDVSGFNVDPAQVQDNRGIDQLVQLSERSRDRNAALQERQSEFAQRTAIAQQEKLRDNRIQDGILIDKATDPNQWDLANNTFNGVMRGKLKDISDKWYGQIQGGADPELVREGIKQDTSELGNLNSSAKVDLENIKNVKATLAKTLPNIDQQQAGQLIDKQFLANYTKTDANGKVGFNPAASIQPTDYLKQFADPKVTAPLVTNTDNTGEFYHGQEKQQAHDSDYTSKAGYVNKGKWNTIVTPGMSDIVFDKNGDPSVQVGSTPIDAIKDKNGNPIRMVNTDVYNKMMGSPARALSFQKLYQDSNDFKKMNDASMQSTGKPMDATTNDMMFRHFLYNDATANLPKYISHDEVQKTPVIRVTNNNITRNAPEINNVFKEVADMAQGANGFLQMNRLTDDQLAVVMSHKSNWGKLKVDPSDPSKTELPDISNTGITYNPNTKGVEVHQIVKDANGQQHIGQRLTTLTEYGANKKDNPGQKAQQELAKQKNARNGGSTTTTPKGSNGFDASKYHKM